MTGVQTCALPICNFCHQWLLSIGLKDENLRLRDHEPEELSFYSKATTDFEFLFPFGWGELWGIRAIIVPGSAGMA